MRYKPLPVGTDDFKKLILNGSYYVDKTLLIKDLLCQTAEVTLFTRPRRFGKTLNLSMLQHFFEDTGDEQKNKENQKLFEGLKITSAGEQYISHASQYPVIFLTLKSAKQPDFEMSFKSLIEDIAREFQRHRFVLESAELSDEDKNKYRRIMQREGEQIDYARAIEFLCRCIMDATGKKTILLLDEYDVPLESAYYGGFYEEMVGFIRSLFESALKTNRCLEFAVITGCLRISKESIFTGLNNLKIVSVLNVDYAEHFGFTEAEVEEMLRYYQLEEKREEITDWYNGYLFGKVGVYNPWSVINYLDSKLADRNAFPKPYWSNTSSNSIVRDLIAHADGETKGEIERLMAGETIEKPVHEDITYEDIYRSKENLWNFLFFTGYLKKLSESFRENEIWLGLAIPNREIKLIYQNQIRNWFQEEIQQRDLKALQEALLSGNAEAFQEELSELLLDTISYMDSKEKESFYHGFLLGVLVNLGNRYRVKSNREAGNGRYDICVSHPSITKPAMIIEIKVAEKAKDLDASAERALEQIVNRKYDAELAKEGYAQCSHIGIGFYRKDCCVKMKKVKLAT